MRKFTAIFGVAAVLALGACGDTDLERGLSGAAVGAGASYIVDGDIFTGAVIGGAAGVLCDDLTNAC